MTLKRQVAAWGNLNHTYASRGYRSIPTTGAITRSVDQTLGIRESATITIRRSAQQTLGIRSEAHSEVSRTSRKSVLQRLGIKTETAESYKPKRSANERLGIRTFASKTTSEKVTQRLGIRPVGKIGEIGFVIQAVQRLGISTDTETGFERIISVLQRFGIRSQTAKTRGVKVVQTLGIKSIRERIVLSLKRSAAQRLGVKSDTDKTFDRKVSVDQTVGVMAKAVKTTYESVKQTLGVHEESVDRMPIQYRTGQQRVGVKTETSTKVDAIRSIIERLGISTRAVAAANLHLSVKDAVGISPAGVKSSKLIRSATERLGIRTTYTTMRSLFRSVRQTLGIRMEVHQFRGFNEIARTAHRIFKLKNATKRNPNRKPPTGKEQTPPSRRPSLRRVFREIKKTTRHRT